jgi:hypothetical protein
MHHVNRAIVICKYVNKHTKYFSQHCMHSWSNTRKEINLGILILDRVKTEASLGVIQEPVVLVGLGNGNDVYKK